MNAPRPPHSNCSRGCLGHSASKEPPKRALGLENLNVEFYNDETLLASLAGQDLTMTNLGSRDLSGFDLRGAHQWSAHQYGLGSYTDGHPEIQIADSLFTGAQLDGAQLCEVIGHFVCFCGASMEKTVLNSSKLTGACFINANLTEATFYNSSIQNSSFSRSNLDGVNLEHAKLVGSCFSRARFSPKTSFQNANLVNCCFVDTNLRHLLRDADVLFSGCEVTGADFRVWPTIAGARLPKRVRIDLQERGAIVDPLSDEDPDESYFYAGYFE
jgi:uncharacterized protein YjbI with pentapeptide repeats